MGIRIAVLAVVLVVASAAPAWGQGAEPPPPAGANDACRASQDPTPVVLVHGTFANRSEVGATLSPQLESAGYCVWALNYGGCRFGSCGRGPIEDSAGELKAFIDRDVLPQSRSGKVSIVGHSQGGLMPRYYLRFLGGQAVVQDMIGLSPSNHGTDNPLAPPAGQSGECAACDQQSPYQSPFTQLVNGDDETLAGVDYTQIQTRWDEVVVPYWSAWLADEPGTPNSPDTTAQNGASTTNFCLQDESPANSSDHLSIPHDQQAVRVVLDALRRDGPAQPPAAPDTVCDGAA